MRFFHHRRRYEMSVKGIPAPGVTEPSLPPEGIYRPSVHPPTDLTVREPFGQVDYVDMVGASDRFRRLVATAAARPAHVPSPGNPPVDLPPGVHITGFGTVTFIGGVPLAENEAVAYGVNRFPIGSGTR